MPLYNKSLFHFRKVSYTLDTETRNYVLQAAFQGNFALSLRRYLQSIKRYFKSGFFGTLAVVGGK